MRDEIRNTKTIENLSRHYLMTFGQKAQYHKPSSPPAENHPSRAAMGTHGFRFGTVLFLALATTSALAGDCTGLANCADCTNVPAIINENSNHRCLNGGTCNTGYSGPSDDICNCPDTTEGVDCGITGVTRCNGGSWCGNTGECKAGGGCDCTVGFTGCALREIRAPRQLQQSLRPPVPTRRLVHWHRQQAVRMRLPQRRPELREERRDLLRARRLHLLRERRLVQSRWRVRLRRGIHRQHLRRDRPRVDEAKARWILGREQEGGHQRRRRGGGPAVPIIAAGSGFMCFMVRRERKGAPLFMKLDDSPAPPPVPDLEMSAQNALPGPPAPPPKA